MKKINNSTRARLNLLLATVLAFAFGVALTSALDLTPLSFAAGDRDKPEFVIGARGAAADLANGGFADVVERIAPAVVTIRVESSAPQRVAERDLPIPPGFERFFPSPDQGVPNDEPGIAVGSGSGFIISDDGYVLTNNHVIESAERIDIELADGRVFEDVGVVGSDPQTDVGLLKIEAASLPVAPLGFSDRIRVGEWVLAIGSPGFVGGGPRTLDHTVTAGIVSATGRSINILGQRFAARDQPNLSIENFIQTDAVINRGNSGGPLINAAGEVVGINTAIASTTGVYQGYGFAVPIGLAREVVDDLIEHGEVRRAVLGVLITGVTSADAKFYGLSQVAGAKVQNFSGEDSPSAEAGLERGDVIVAVEGQPVASVPDIQRRIRSFEPGESVKLDVVRRDRTRHEVSVRLAAAPNPSAVESSAASREEDADILGAVDVEALDRDARRELRLPAEAEGVLVLSGPRRGLLGRNLPLPVVISDINGDLIEDVADYERLISNIGPGDVISLTVWIRGAGAWTSQIVSLEVPTR